MDLCPIDLRYLIRFLLLFPIIAALIITRQLLVPLFLSILFAYMLFPAAEKLETVGLPRIATNLLLIIGSFALAAGIIYGLTLLIISFTDSLPDIQSQI